MSSINRQVRSGNRMLVVIDGIVVGLAQNCRLSDDYGPEPASGIGDIHVIENVPTMARHSVSVSQMVLNVGSLRDAGIYLENGDDALQGRVYDIQAVDKDSGGTLRKYVGCSYASGDVEINKHSILITNGQFQALDVAGTGV